MSSINSNNDDDLERLKAAIQEQLERLKKEGGEVGRRAERHDRFMNDPELLRQMDDLFQELSVGKYEAAYNELNDNFELLGCAACEVIARASIVIPELLTKGAYAVSFTQAIVRLTLACQIKYNEQKKEQQAENIVAKKLIASVFPEGEA